VDEIPLSRPKRNIARDFSDGGEDAELPLDCSPLAINMQESAKASCTHDPLAVLAAEVVHHYFPKLVELHNYRQGGDLLQRKSQQWCPG
jgi:hypothetical protein